MKVRNEKFGSKQLKASTLIEVITAMVIILTCASIALMIFSNLSRDVNDDLRILAEIKINTWAAETKKNTDFTEATQNLENIRLERSILLYPKKSRLRVLLIEAFTPSGKKLTQYKEIISIEDKKP
jgi:competence protein ComGF